MPWENLSRSNASHMNGQLGESPIQPGGGAMSCSSTTQWRCVDASRLAVTAWLLKHGTRGGFMLLRPSSVGDGTAAGLGGAAATAGRSRLGPS